MIGLLLLLLLGCLGVASAYTTVLFGADRLLTDWQQRGHKLAQAPGERVPTTRQVMVAVLRITVTYIVVRHCIRQTAGQR